MQKNGQNDKDLFSDLNDFKSRSIILCKEYPTDSELMQIMIELDEFHERIKGWFKHPEQPTKGRIKL
jgi:hypothetical protein